MCLKDISLSIITPTYNRVDLLKNCFSSLLVQTCCDFEWIIVDDGSSDQTKEIFSEIAKKKLPFRMTYVWKENGGKHSALNVSHPFIHGRYILLLDSDDTLIPSAVETVISVWKKYENNAEIGIITFLRQLKDGTIVAKGRQEGIPLDVLNNKRICFIANDCCETLRAKLFLKYPFPVFEGEKFLAETALWYRVGLEAKCVYVNKPIYICEYLSGGLTKGGKELRIANCQGGMYTSYLRMNHQCSTKERMKAAILFVCYARFCRLSYREIMKRAKEYKLLSLLFVLPGDILHLFWKKKYKNE